MPPILPSKGVPLMVPVPTPAPMPIGYVPLTPDRPIATVEPNLASASNAPIAEGILSAVDSLMEVPEKRRKRKLEDEEIEYLRSERKAESELRDIKKDQLLSSEARAEAAEKRATTQDKRLQEEYEYKKTLRDQDREYLEAKRKFEKGGWEAKKAMQDLYMAAMKDPSKIPHGYELDHASMGFKPDPVYVEERKQTAKMTAEDRFNRRKWQAEHSPGQSHLYKWPKSPADMPKVGVPIKRWNPAGPSTDLENAKTLSTEATKQAIEREEAVRDAAADAVSSEAEMHSFLKSNHAVDTGGIYNNAKVWILKQAGDEDVANMIKINSKLTPLSRPPGSGTTSDKDMALYKAATIGPDKPSALNRAIASGQIAAARREQDKNEFYTAFKDYHGTVVGAEEAWMEYVNANPIFDHSKSTDPRLINEDPANAIVSLNENALPWQEYFSQQNTSELERMQKAREAQTTSGPLSSSAPLTTPGATAPAFGTQLSQAEEAQFQEWMRTDPNVVAWRNEFVQTYGEEPQIDGSNYDYRGAWKAGLTPSISSADNKYHWGSKGQGGVDLKSADHPTLWKTRYMEATGQDPDAIGITKEEAEAQMAGSGTGPLPSSAPLGQDQVTVVDPATGQPRAQQPLTVTDQGSSYQISMGGSPDYYAPPEWATDSRTGETLDMSQYDPQKVRQTQQWFETKIAQEEAKGKRVTDTMRAAYQKRARSMLNSAQNRARRPTPTTQTEQSEFDDLGPLTQKKVEEQLLKEAYEKITKILGRKPTEAEAYAWREQNQEWWARRYSQIVGTTGYGDSRVRDDGTIVKVYNGKEGG